jgi:hypothetical protein
VIPKAGFAHPSLILMVLEESKPEKLKVNHHDLMIAKSHADKLCGELFVQL